MVLVERVRDRLDSRLRDAEAARYELAVVGRMDDEAIREREQARGQRSHVYARQGTLALADVLRLMELDHHPRTDGAGGSGEGDVVVQDGTCPPLEDDRLRPGPAQERECARERRNRVPVHAVQHRDARVEPEFAQIGADSRAAGIEAPRQQAPHEQCRRLAARVEGIHERERVIGDPAEEHRARAHHADTAATCCSR